jgi:ABC-type transport system substrate-binding protein
VKGLFRSAKGLVSLPLVGLVIFSLFIVACGSEEAAAPATEPAAVAPAASAATTAPVATKAPAAATTAAAATATPKPRPTATPKPVVKVPVQARLTVTTAPTSQGGFAVPGHGAAEGTTPHYDGLVNRHHKTNQTYPGMAKSWAVETNGKNWTFELRDDIYYNKGGKPTNVQFKAADIALTYGFPLGIDNKWASSIGYWTSVYHGPEYWATPDDFTFEFNLPKVNLDLIALSDRGIVSQQWWDEQGGVEGYSDDPIGTGPWTHLEWDSTTHALVEKVDDHFRQTPFFDEYQIILVTEGATQIAMLIAGESDISPVDAANFQVVRDAGMIIRKASLPATQIVGDIGYYRENSYVDPETGKHPGKVQCSPCAGYDPNDPLRVADARLALSHAVDRNALNTAFFNGDGFPLIEYFPPWQAAWKDEWAPYPGPQGKTGGEGGWPYDYNVDKAKAYLASAGFPNGFEMTIYCLSQRVGNLCDVAEAVQGYYADIGVTAKIVDMKVWGEFQSKIARCRCETSWMLMSAPSLDPPCQAPTWQMYWEGGNGWREFPEASVFLKKCQTVTSNEERVAETLKFGQAYWEQSMSTPFMWNYTYAGFNPAVVADYSVNMTRQGPRLYHEYTEPVYK